MASTSRESRRSMPPDDKRTSRHSPEKKKETSKPSKCLGVFALSYTTTEQVLEQEFEKYGSIEKINLIVDGFTKRSRGFAFVYFDHLKDAVKAKESMDGQTLDGRELKVDFSLTSEGHKRTPGVYIQRGVEVPPENRARGGHSSYRGRGGPSHRGRGGHYSSRDYDRRDYRDEGRTREYYDDRYRRDYSPSSSRYYSRRPLSSSNSYHASRYPHPRERDDPSFDEEERYFRDRYPDRSRRDQDFARYYEKDRYYERSPPPRHQAPPREYERRGPAPRGYGQKSPPRDYDRRDSRRDYEQEKHRGYEFGSPSRGHPRGSPPPLSRRHAYAPTHRPRRTVSRSPRSRHGSPRPPPPPDSRRRDRSRSPPPARMRRSRSPLHYNSPSPLPQRGGQRLRGSPERSRSRRSLSRGRKKSRSKSSLKITIKNKSKRSVSRRSRSRSLRRSSSRSSNRMPLHLPRVRKRSSSPRSSNLRSAKSTSPVKRYN